MAVSVIVGWAEMLVCHVDEPVEALSEDSTTIQNGIGLIKLARDLVQSLSGESTVDLKALDRERVAPSVASYS